MALGKRLDKRAGRGSYREVLAASLLRIRNKRGAAGEAGDQPGAEGI